MSSSLWISPRKCTYSSSPCLETSSLYFDSINNIDYIKILVNDKENDFFDNEYTRSYGINKEYNITSLKDLNDVTLYYVSKYNDVNYYIPVTKYINSNEDKIKIIIEELSSKSSHLLLYMKLI